MLPSSISNSPTSIIGRPLRRGGQPNNTNARKHSFYSSRDPSSLRLALTRATQRTNLARAGLLPVTKATSANKRITFQILSDLHSLSTKSSSQLLIETRALKKATSQCISLAMLEFNRTAGPRHLLLLAENASTLNSLYKAKLMSREEKQVDKIFGRPVPNSPSPDFYEVLPPAPALLPGSLCRKVPAPAPIHMPRTLLPGRSRLLLPGRPEGAGEQPPPCLFIPLSIEDPHTRTTYNGLPSSPASFLNDRHWHAIQPLLDNLHQEISVILVRKSRLIPYPDRFLLDGILWKLAIGSNWSDLPAPYPIRRCQKLYRQLCHTGSMALILTHLHQDLVGYGDTDLETIALSGKYALFRNRIFCRTKTHPTWQELIALLLLQCSQKTSLRLQRLFPPPFSLRRLPGYRPGLLRLPGLRMPRRVQPFVPPALTKKDTLRGYFLLKIPSPMDHPTLKGLRIRLILPIDRCQAPLNTSSPKSGVLITGR